MRFSHWLAAVFVAIGIAPAAAQDFPKGPITIIVPFSAGGPTDTVTRLVAEPMSKELGTQVVVQNVGGAGGTLGAGQAAKAQPDGQTLLLHHIGMSTAPTLYRNLPFDPIEGFEPVGLVTEVPMVIVARKDFPPNTLQELIDYVKANKDKVTYANAGIGAASHLCGMLFMNAIDTELTTVPYQGTGPALTDLVGGQVDFMCDQTTNTTGQIKGGEIKAYAVTTPQRLDALPDLPTADEAGLPGFEVAVWHGLYAPKGTPAPVIEKLQNALKAALKDPTMVKRFADLGTSPSPEEDVSPQALRDHLKAQTELWKPIIEKAGVYAQ
ncbi:tripartite tricarboxylate transporter substrate-binding protein [Rhodoligotrophos defluvii]|uniref:tripartite tricarboxylate transporter substrate-binding protein n=1 Tax=Rhodoligotrophos defluvii TaxID=2561934 RepID=UPI0010C9CFA2|nr:tripartite tricarboxylate transporter substrate-binding protein [Rhodoligotrophos defluvii]